MSVTRQIVPYYCVCLLGQILLGGPQECLENDHGRLGGDRLQGSLRRLATTLAKPIPNREGIIVIEHCCVRAAVGAFACYYATLHLAYFRLSPQLRRSLPDTPPSVER